MAGQLQVGISMPAIGVTSVSALRRNTVSMNEQKTLVSERVQVSLLMKMTEREGEDYPGLTAAMSLIRQACPDQHGTIAGVSVTSVLPDIEGPDLPGDAAGIISRSQDFIVRWHESR